MAIKYISIPKPCHEQWQQMAVAGNGRYCDHCCKTVVDFSVMSNEEVIAHLTNRDKVCGRFAPFQLSAINNQLAIERTSSFKGRFMMAFLGGLMAFTNSKAKEHYIKTDKHSEMQKSMVSDTIIKKTSKMRSSAKRNSKMIKADTLTLEPMNSHTGNLPRRDISDTVFKANNLNLTFLSGTVGGIYVRRPFIWRAWHKIKNLF